MVERIRYEKKTAPTVAQALSEIKTKKQTWRVRVRSCRPDWCIGPTKKIRHVHANIKFKNGRETTRSKSLTQHVLSLPVARATKDGYHGIMMLYVSEAWGCIRRREKQTQPDAGLSIIDAAIADAKRGIRGAGRQPMSLWQDPFYDDPDLGESLPFE